MLKGLTLSDVSAYIDQVAHIAVQPRFSGAMFDETEGDPFFQSEVVDLLAQHAVAGGL